MGGSSKKETTQTAQVTQPWGPAQPLLGGILGQLGGQLGNVGVSPLQSQALAGLLGQAGFLGRFGPQVTGLANTLLAGGTDRGGMIEDAWRQYLAQAGPTAAGQFLDPASNPFYRQLTERIGDDVTNRVNALYAGAGRDPAGAGSFPQTLARGIAEGVAPVTANIYDTERGRQLAAAQSLYGAGSQTAGLLSQLDQLALANRQAGIGAAQAAQGFANAPFQQQLAVEAQRLGIPMDQLARIAQIGIPIAGLGSSSTGTSTATSSTPFNPLQTAVGAGLGLAGLFR